MRHKPLLRVVLQVLGLFLMIQSVTVLIGQCLYLIITWLEGTFSGVTMTTSGIGIGVEICRLGFGFYLLSGGRMVLNLLMPPVRVSNFRN